MNSALAFYGAGMVLFFFWAYGIVAFVLDLKNKFVPGFRQYRRGRKRIKEQKQQEQERDELEEQLY